MKKILLLLSLLVAFFVSNAQYPVVQFLGRDSALVDSRGGLKARLINYAFTDTTEANTQRINQYPGAMIYTTTGDKLWLRNSIASLWVEVGTGGGGGGGISAVGAINGASKSVNGSVISGATIYFQTVDGTYPGLMTPAQKARLDSNSYMTIDKRYDSLAWRRNDSTFLIKSLRVQAGDSTVTPTVTDSSVSYNIPMVQVDTTGVSYNKIAYWDTTGTDKVKFRNETAGTGAFSVLGPFRPGIDENAPAVLDTMLINTGFSGKYLFVYRGYDSTGAQLQEQVYNDTGFFRANDTTIYVKPPFGDKEWWLIEARDSIAYTQLTLQTPPANNLLLDTYTGATGAYSVRKLRTLYSGYAIKVRRSSDNATQDIGFLPSGYLDTASMKTFVSTGTGYVDTWYDQSTNGYNLTQATPGNQPVIIESGGTVYRTGGDVSIKFTSGSSQYLTNSSITGSSLADAYIAQVFKSNSTNSNYIPFGASGQNFAYQHGATLNRINVFAGNVSGDFPNSSTSLQLSETIYDGGGVADADRLKYYLNTSAQTASSYSGTVPSTVSFTGLAIGKLYAIGVYFDGSSSEFILWGNDKSADRTGIEANINAFYNAF